MRGRIWELVLAVAVAVPLAGAGQDRPADVPAAVGWLGTGGGPVAGRSSCSGVLVAPDLVVTAAHCLIDRATGQTRPAGTLTFLAGLGAGPKAVAATGAAVILPAPRQILGRTREYDLALLRLANALPAGIAPLPLASAPAETGEALTSLGYPISAMGKPQRLDGCPVVAVETPVVGLGCPATTGNSGGAILRAETGGWALVAVMVARGTGGPVGTYAVTLPPDLAARLAAQ